MKQLLADIVLVAVCLVAHVEVATVHPGHHHSEIVHLAEHVETRDE